MSLSKVKGIFGKLVIGKERVEEEKKFIDARRHKFGPLVLGDLPPVVGNQPAPKAIPVTSKLSIESMAMVLKNNPAFVAALANQEFARERDAIRPDALKLFIEHAPNAYTDPVQCKVLIGRCERFLATGADDAAVAPLTKTHVARAKQAGVKEVVNDPKNAKIKAATAPGKGTIK